MQPKKLFLNGDQYGRQNPVMENFMQEIGIDGLLNGVKLNTESHNIEGIYSDLATKPEYADVVNKNEEGIVANYSQMQIPVAAVFDIISFDDILSIPIGRLCSRRAQTSSMSISWLRPRATTRTSCWTIAKRRM